MVTFSYLSFHFNYHINSQLFGEEDPDQDVSPDTADPEAAGDSGRLAVDTEAKSSGAGGIERVSTREWAEASDHDPQKLFKKVSVCLWCF